MPRPLVDGILVLDKPRDVTSMDMVRMAKRLSHVKRVGHAGTLDPIATGVLPICFGQATRLMEYLVDSRKTYRAEFTMGSATDSYDAYGAVTSTGDPSSVTRAQVEALLPLFTGAVKQQPPMYSALKWEGKRLYELARAGVEVERPARDVMVHSLTLLVWAPPAFELEVECGRGFYMRTLAHDIGNALGCGAHLSALTRVRTGLLSIEQAATPEAFEAAAAAGTWEELLEPPDVALLAMKPVAIGLAGERHLRNGVPITLGVEGLSAEHMEARRAYGTDGRFIGVVRFNRAQGQWQPEKLLRTSAPSRYAPAGV